MLRYKTETRPGLVALHEWHPARKRSGSILTTPEPARGQMSRGSCQLYVQRTRGDHKDAPISHGWEPYSRIWDHTISHSLKQWIWPRNCLCGGCSRCMQSWVACQKRRWWRISFYVKQQQWLVILTAALILDWIKKEVGQVRKVSEEIGQVIHSLIAEAFHFQQYRYLHYISRKLDVVFADCCKCVEIAWQNNQLVKLITCWLLKPASAGNMQFWWCQLCSYSMVINSKILQFTPFFSKMVWDSPVCYYGTLTGGRSICVSSDDLERQNVHGQNLWTDFHNAQMVWPRTRKRKSMFPQIFGTPTCTQMVWHTVTKFHLITHVG